MAVLGDKSQWSSNDLNQLADVVGGTLSAIYNVKAGYGAIGDGVADDTAAIQAAIDACPAGSTVFLPTGLYKITSVLSITKSIEIFGAGCSSVFGGTTSGFDAPTVSPYIRGAVLLQATAATNAINITGTGVSVNLRDFGIRFADAIRFVNTGHGINASPTATVSSGHDHGVVTFVWDNIRVFGHDGNHYAFTLLNPLLGTMNNLHGYGGGLIRVECDSYAGNYGNLVFNHVYGDVFCAGTAHGIELVARVGSGSQGMLNLITFIRPQVITESQVGKFAETTPPTAAQYLFKANATASTNNLAVINPDLETGVLSLTDFGSGVKFIDPSGLITISTDVQSQAWTKTPSPTIAAGAGAGTSPAASTISGDDFRGTIVGNIGTAPPAAGQNIWFVTWSTNKIPKFIGLQANDSFAAAMQFYVTNITSSGFGIRSGSVPGAGGSYNLSYIVAR